MPITTPSIIAAHARPKILRFQKLSMSLEDEAARFPAASLWRGLPVTAETAMPCRCLPFLPIFRNHPENGKIEKKRQTSFILECVETRSR